MRHPDQPLKSALMIEPEDINDSLSPLNKVVDYFILKTDSDQITRYSDYSALSQACLNLRTICNEATLFLSCQIDDDLLKEKRLVHFLKLGVTGIFLENCAGRSTLQQLDAILTVAEAQCGLMEKNTSFIAQTVTTPETIFALAEYKSAPDRLIGIAFDEGRLLATLCNQGFDKQYNLYLAHLLVTFAAAAANQPAYRTFRQEEQITPAHYLQARQEGYKGIITTKINDIDVIKAISDTN